MIKELQEIEFKILNPCDLKILTIQQDQENTDYSGVTIHFKDYKMKFRNAKITPKKIGQFVTFWKKNADHKNEPYHLNDDFDYYIVAAKQQERFGFFFFSKQVLAEENILTNDKKLGKMGFRVYPVWDFPTNKQAAKTKQWQSDYFVELNISEQKYMEKFKSIFK